MFTGNFVGSNQASGHRKTQVRISRLTDNNDSFKKLEPARLQGEEEKKRFFNRILLYKSEDFQ